MQTKIHLGLSLVALALSSGCSSWVPKPALPDYCLVDKNMKRAPLTDEQQKVCTYGNAEANAGYSMFSRPAWGMANDFTVQTGSGLQYR